MGKRLPIGISDFKEIIEEDYAYVDKTLFIEELINQGSKVALIPRHRRFGKTLNLSMLRYFFDKAKEDTSHLFKNLNIWKQEKYRALQGKYPVIFLSLKDIKHSSWELTFASFLELISAEFRRHRYLQESEILAEDEKQIFNDIIFNRANQPLAEKSLFLLSEWLHRYYNERVVLLIDEYDTPAHAAYVGKFYDSLIAFLRNWLSSVLKDNPYLERGVLTGILRIAKESIFSGLNNVGTFTILDEIFQDKFGLLEFEVQELLEGYGLSQKLPEFKEWYNGYRIGSCEGIYNPWSVLNCINRKGALAPYWVNTSDNALMKELIAKSRWHLKADIERLLNDEIVEKRIEEGIVFSELEQGSTAIWSLLLFTGYLTLNTTPSYGVPCQLCIPNKEVKELYQSMVISWFEKSIDLEQYKMLLDSLVIGDICTFSKILKEFVLSSVSIFDVAGTDSEKVYHAFILGLLVGLKDRYEVKSNRESGYGRYDVTLFPKNTRDLGIVMEFRKEENSENLEKAAQAAIRQIQTKKYAQDLQERQVDKILLLGIAFKGKDFFISQHPLG